MRFWRRSGSVQIGNNRYKLDGLKYSYKVVLDETPPTAEVEIYNLSESTRNNVKVGQPLIISAGYDGDVGTLFIGEVTKVEHAPSGVDMVTKLTGKDGAKAWIERTINKTYAKKTNAKVILDDLLKDFGMEVAGVKLAQNAYYPRGKTCKGKLQTVLREIIEQDCGSRLLIRNNQIIINPPARGINTGALLSPSTGLLAGIKRNDKDGEASDSDKGDYELTTLLNYYIGIGDVVRVQCRELSGQYKVVGGNHEGSSDGSYITTIEVSKL